MVNHIEKKVIPVKILHTSDWHLGKRPAGTEIYSETRYQDYFKAAEYIVQQAINEKVELFIISGDLFDSNRIDPDILYRTENILKNLKDANITTLAILGNHDTSYERDSWINYLEKKDLIINLDFFREGENFQFKPYVYQGLKIYGIPYQGSLTEETLQALAQELDGKDNIVLTHTAINDFESQNWFLPGCVKSEVIDLFADKVIYIAAGHFHSYKAYPKDKPFFFIPGSPEYWDIYEKDDKGFIIFDVEEKTHRFYQSFRRKRSMYKTTISQIDEFIDNLSVQDGEIIILTITIDQDTNNDISKIKDTLKNKGALTIDIKFDYSLRGFQNSQIDPHLSKKLMEKQIISGWENLFASTQTNVERTYEFLQKAKTLLEENADTNNLFEPFDNLLNQLTTGAEEK